MKNIFSIFILLCTLTSFKNDRPKAVSIQDTKFVVPVKHKIVLAGSFGELRGRHFHAGLDIKSKNGGEGDSVFSAESGHISRIKIQRGGYGKVLYIDHENGYTTVYAHLKSFNAEIDEYILSMQKALLSYELEVVPENEKFKVIKGEHIAFLGNSGRSSGPHLHFEIRETTTDKPMNPLLFGIQPMDQVAPVINSIRIAGLRPDFNKIYEKKFNAKKDRNDVYEVIVAEIPAWRAGISFTSFDKMSDSHNKNGFFKMEMYVDDTLFYHIDMSSFSLDETRQIDAHTDYEVKQRDNKTEVLCYRMPGNNLSIIKSDYNHGLIPLFKDRYRNVRIILEDYAGNKCHQYLQLRRQDTDDYPSYGLVDNIPQGIESFYKSEGIGVTFYKESLSKNLNFFIKKTENDYQIGTSTSAILSNIRLAVAIPESFKNRQDKLSFVKKNGSGKTNFGSKVEGDSLITFIDDFGTYGFYYDSLPPQIKPHAFTTTTKIATFKFKIEEEVYSRSNARPFSYGVWIDDQWLPCEFKESAHILYVGIDHLLKGEHFIKITTRDEFANESNWSSVFVKE